MGASTKTAASPMSVCALVFPTLSLSPTPGSQLLDLISAAQPGALLPSLIMSQVLPVELGKQRQNWPIPSTGGRICENRTSRESVFVLKRREALAYFGEETASHN